MMFDAVAFAGGGNRCYWQGGFWEAVRERYDLKPSLVVGASAGAFQASYSLLGLGGKVRPLVLAACRSGVPNIDWRRRTHPSKALFPVGPMYRELIETVFDEDALARLKALTDLKIAIARPPRHLPETLAIALGLLAYQAEKKITHPVHPKSGRSIGFTPDFLRVRDMAHPRDLADALMASAGVPPFMPRTSIGGRVAVDGGLVDNVPVGPLEEIEKAGGRTLVLLTRRYREIPIVKGRTYIQPSETLRVSQFDITNAAGIEAAYLLGLKDGNRFAGNMPSASLFHP